MGQMHTGGLISDMAKAAFEAGAILERGTVYPFIVTITGELDGRHQRNIHVIQAPLSIGPDWRQLVPAGMTGADAEIVLAEELADTPAQHRTGLRPQYRAFLMWRKAWALQKPVAALVAWEEYDPIAIDEAVERWERPGAGAIYWGD